MPGSSTGTSRTPVPMALDDGTRAGVGVERHRSARSAAENPDRVAAHPAARRHGRRDERAVLQRLRHGADGGRKDQAACRPGPRSIRRRDPRRGPRQRGSRPCRGPCDRTRRSRSRCARARGRAPRRPAVSTRARCPRPRRWRAARAAIGPELRRPGSRRGASDRRSLAAPPQSNKPRAARGPWRRTVQLDAGPRACLAIFSTRTRSTAAASTPRGRAPPAVMLAAGHRAIQMGCRAR